MIRPKRSRRLHNNLTDKVRASPDANSERAIAAINGCKTKRNLMVMVGRSMRSRRSRSVASTVIPCHTAPAMIRMISSAIHECRQQPATSAALNRDRSCYHFAAPGLGDALARRSQKPDVNQRVAVVRPQPAPRPIGRTSTTGPHWLPASLARPRMVILAVLTGTGQRGLTRPVATASFCTPFTA